jgi:hypothetical protein
MALPDFIDLTQGTAIVWGEAGASGVTHTLSLDALANGAARMGAAADLGADFAERYALYILAETGTAPTASNTIDVYLLFSYDNSTWPAKVTGSDGAYTLGTSDANLRQAGNAFSLIATNDTDTVLVQSPFIVAPRGRYVVPIYDNNLGTALRDEATATNNGSRVILVPLRPKVVD